MAKRAPALRTLLRPLRIRKRRQRHQLFITLLASVPKPIRILDVGGGQRFWERMEFVGVPDVEITILNVRPVNVRHDGFTFVFGDARDIPFEPRSFDVVFSNSVIEHVGRHDDQRRMADEARRVAKRYFIQTPNRYFPLEPHFFVPFFQFLPLRVKVFLLQNLPLLYKGKIRNRKEAIEKAGSIRLMTARELHEMFPEATFVKERSLGLTKSFIAHHGF